MKKYSFIDLLIESKKEIVIWGVSPGAKEEQLLYTGAKSMQQAIKVKDILEKKHKCKNVRIQSFSMDDDIAKDWKNMVKEEKIDKNKLDLFNKLWAHFEKLYRLGKITKAELKKNTKDLGKMNVKDLKFLWTKERLGLYK